MNDFKESLKVDIERKNSGEIIITEPLKDLLIELMKGNISKKELMEKTNIGDKVTVELKVKQIVAESPELEPLYDEYVERKSENFSGYKFRAEAIEMLRKNYSQSIMSEKIGINRRSFSTKIKQLQQENSDNILGKLLKEHAERQMKRKKINECDLLSINSKLDEYEEQYPVGQTKYEKRSPIEVRKENLENVVSLIEGLIQEGMTLKEMSEQNIISESYYRKCKMDLEELTKILDNKQEKGQ